MITKWFDVSKQDKTASKLKEVKVNSYVKTDSRTKLYAAKNNLPAFLNSLTPEIREEFFHKILEILKLDEDSFQLDKETLGKWIAGFTTQDLKGAYESFHSLLEYLKRIIQDLTN